MKSSSTISPVMAKLSAYIAGAAKKPLPAEVVECAKIHLVDTVGAIISGSRLLPGREAYKYIKAQGGRKEAGVMGTRLITSAPNAAFANGMFAHADETDDSHAPSRTHPGASVVPSALAIGERDGLSGKVLLRAMVLGYDVCTRMLLAMDQLKFRYTGHHASSFGGVFGAATAAASLLGLDARRTRYLLSYAAEQAAGLYSVHRDSRHIEKSFAMGGMTAHNGTAAALMVASGFTGVDDVFSGDRDFFHTFAPAADRSRLVAGLGRDYEIMRCGIKRWSVGGPIQGPLHVLHDLIRQHGLKAQDIEKIKAWMPEKELETVDNRDMPNICVQHLLAVMAIDGTVTLQAANDHLRLKAREVLAVRKRVEVVGDPKLTNALRRWCCVMEITLKNGRKLKHQTMAAKGSPENPLNRRDEEEKALGLIAPVLGKRRAQALLAALWNFDRIKDVRSLRKLSCA